jgi:hypothetical protein
MKKIFRNLLRVAGFHMVRPYIPKSHDPRTSSATKVALVEQFNRLSVAARSNQVLPRFSDCGFRIFSQFEEDGLLLYLAAVLEIQNKTFIDIGAANGIASNCSNLALNLGWHGLFIDGSVAAIQDGKEFYSKHPDTELYPPVFKSGFVTAENINELITKSGFKGAVGVVSIDIDGNDCWVWKSLQAVDPAIVVIETHIEFGEQNIAVPYDPDYVYPGKHPQYHGASAAAMVRLGKSKGYRLVGANRFGFNLFFVRNDIFPERVPEVAAESILTHPRYFERLQLTADVKNWDFVSF